LLPTLSDMRYRDACRSDQSIPTVLATLAIESSP
jgi:hypothetical protein